MKLKINRLMLIISLLSTSYGCKETKYETVKKVVNAKIERYRQVAFEDGSDYSFSFGLYSLMDKGDTVVFKCIEGADFYRWNCSFVEIKKRKKDLSNNPLKSIINEPKNIKGFNLVNKHFIYVYDYF